MTMEITIQQNGEEITMFNATHFWIEDEGVWIGFDELSPELDDEDEPEQFYKGATVLACYLE